MKYRVHTYALIRFPIEVEAPDHQLAMEMARQQFESIAPDDYAEEISYFLVDEPDNEDGTWYFGDGRTWDQKVAEVARALGHVDVGWVGEVLKRQGFSGT